MQSYKQNDKVKNKSFVVISEPVKHDTNCVHLFNEKLISYLKFGSQNVKKFITLVMEQLHSIRINVIS